MFLSFSNAIERNNMKESLSSYYTFYEVARCGNISKAAAALYTSQPAVSKSIRKLEEDLHTTLFIRSSKGVLLTPEGKLLYDHAAQAFASLSAAEQQLSSAACSGGGTLHIGVSATLCKYLLLPYLSRFISRHPNIRVSISCQSTHETLKLLESDAIDIGLVGKPEHLKDLIYWDLDEIEDIFVATDAYISRLPQDAVTTKAILESSTLMLLDKNNMTRQYIDDYLSKNRIQTRDYIEISSMDLLIEFARIGLGVACVIKNFVTDDLSSGALTQIALDIPIHKRRVGFAYKKTHLQNPALNKFLESPAQTPA